MEQGSSDSALLQSSSAHGKTRHLTTVQQVTEEYVENALNQCYTRLSIQWTLNLHIA